MIRKTANHPTTIDQYLRFGAVSSNKKRLTQHRLRILPKRKRLPKLRPLPRLARQTTLIRAQSLRRHLPLSGTKEPCALGLIRTEDEEGGAADEGEDSGDEKDPVVVVYPAEGADVACSVAYEGSYAGTDALREWVGE